MFGWKKKQKPGDAPVTTMDQDEKLLAKGAVVSVRSEPSELTVTIKERSGCNVAMAIEVPRQDVEGAREASFRRVQSVAKLPGFRSGKVPLELVKKNFEGTAWEDAVDQVLRDSIRKALDKERLVGVAPPTVDHLEAQPGRPLRFELKVECAPEVSLKEYKGLPLSRKVREVTEEDVEKRIQGFRDSQAKLVLSKETVVEKKHFVVVDYEAFLDGAALADTKASDQLIEMAAPQSVEGFAEGLLGAKDGETREISVVFPTAHPRKELAGKTLIFKTTVTAIKEKELPALDDEFAKDVGATDLAQLRRDVRNELIEGNQRSDRESLEKQVTDALLERNSFEVPATQVEQETVELTQRLKRLLMDRGASLADWETNEPKMREKNRPEAERRIRLSYVLEKILQTEKIEVSDADLEASIVEMVEKARPDERATLQEWAQSRRERLRSQIRERRLFDFLIDHGNISEVNA